VAGSLGYCGLDPQRAPLRGDEIRACWEARPATAAATVVALPVVAGSPPPTRQDAVLGTHPNRIDFVEVGGRPDRLERPRRARSGRSTPADPVPPVIEPDGSAASGLVAPEPPRWSLWGDLEG
jgi:hypothetical protein